ncbi:MAG: homocysteine S-methyltransferase family protein [Pirellulaceae bacterium]|nr:homocysteine S-methyltransferase family protein [Pirellulaceae bacterium]
MDDFLSRLAAPGPIALDGATGTELQRRGFPTQLPLWSAAALWECPDLLLRIHQDYVQAGAELLTANTFRTHGRNLAAAGRQDQAGLWTHRAVELARQAAVLARQAAGERVWVAGSLAPLEDCYCPELVPPDDDLRREHSQMARHLAEAGVDLILVETQNSIREAVAATRAAVATGLPVLTSFVCGPDGRLLSGESVTEAAHAVRILRPGGLLINCAPAPDLAGPLAELIQAAGGLPVGAYGNIGRPDPQLGWQLTDAQDPSGYARYARQWIERGARLIGGCCGTTPEHVRALRALIDEQQDR